MTTEITFESSKVPLGTVSEGMFGGNFLIDRDRLVGDGTYDDAIRDLHLTNLRYPGGTVTEWFFDINDPDKTTGWDPERGAWRELLPLSDFMAQAAEAGVGVNMVLPTGNLLADGDVGTRVPKDSAYEDVRSFVYDLLSGQYGDAEIVSLEIGNEYWLGGGMHVTEYAQIASVIAEASQAAIDQLRTDGLVAEDWDEPEIAIQIGQYGKYSTDLGWVQNDYLVDAITDEAAEAIDAVVAHYYAAGDYEDLENTIYRFNRLDTWNENERFGDLEYYITEWNVAGNASDELGMRGASVMFYIFSEMVLQGVDAAFAWPVQQNTDITLTGNEGSTNVTIAGEAFRLLSGSVSGMDLTARHDFGNGHVYVYESGGETVVYIASRADQMTEVELDLAALGLADSFYWTTHLGTDGLLDDPDAAPILTIEAGFTNTGDIATFDIGAYGIIRITFESGSAPDGYSGSEATDILVGSSGADALEGNGGSDTISGGAGADYLMGGDGDDSIDGGDQSDIILAGDGNDEVIGGNGRDDVDLGNGDDVFWDNMQGGVYGIDTVRGGNGNDVINGGAGDDIFFGDDGNDTITGSGGHDDISGGAGDDSLSGGNGNDKISGNDGADKLWGGGGDDMLSGGWGNDELRSGSGDDVVQADKGNDKVWDTGGADEVWLGTGDDSFVDGDETDDGDDEVHGGSGKDTIVARAGNDQLWGDSEDDWLSGGAGNDILDGGTGRDRLEGGNDDDLLNGGDDGDTLRGDEGDDILYGGSGRDRLEGGAGNDLLIGGDDCDWLFGGEGFDIFAFDSADGRNSVHDFEIGDIIRIEGTDLEFEDLLVRYHNGGAVEISFADTAIVLMDPGMVLDAGDFLFV